MSASVQTRIALANRLVELVRGGDMKEVASFVNSFDVTTAREVSIALAAMVKVHR